MADSNAKTVPSEPSVEVKDPWSRLASPSAGTNAPASSFKKFGLRVKLANKLGQLKKPARDVEEIKRHFTFDPKAVQRQGCSLSEMFEKEEVEEDFNEIVDQDDERVEELVSQDLVGHMVEGPAFRYFILGVIILNTILIGLGTNEKLSVEYSWLFSIFDTTVLIIFIGELMLKWFNGFFIYWRVGWNVLDFFIILTLLLGPTFTFLGSSRILRILRVIRAFRGLRSVSAFAGLSVVIQTIFQSIPDMTNIVILLFIFMVVLSVAGVSLFKGDFPMYFGDLGSALFSLFICVTQDGWMGIFEKFQDSDHYFTGGIYLTICVVIGAFVFANLVVAVVVTNLDKAITEVKEENKMREDLLATKLVGTDDPEHDKEVPIVSIDSVTKKTDFGAQKPLFFGDFTHMTKEKLENYIMILIAMERNLAEYKKIRLEIDEIFSLVNKLNNDEEVLHERDGRKRSSNLPQDIDFETIGRRGDILSNLLELEKRNLISTTKGIGQAVRDAARLVDQSRQTDQAGPSNTK